MLIGAGAAAVAPAGPDGLMPFKAAVAAADSVYVAFVVDFGQGSGSPQVVSGCVKVPSGQNGYAALADFAQQLNWPAPSYNSAGLLCTIDGYGASVCGQVVGSGYNYWSYWHGDSGTWAYSSTGASRTMQTGEVEGWRFQNPGSGNPSDPAPAAGASFSSICTSAAIAALTPPTSATTTPAGAPTGPDPAGSPSPTLPGGTNLPGGTDGGAATTTPGAGATTTVPGSPAAGTGPTTTTTTLAGGSTTHPGSPGTSGSRGEALARTGSAQHNGNSNDVPLVVGGIIVVLLALGALYRWRRQPGAP
jgi:hypothetical protein